MKIAGVSSLAGIVSAFAASLCCLPPVLALVGGLSGAATGFTWMEPLRPYLITLTVISLGYSFYRVYRTSPQSGCCKNECATPGPSFLHSKTFVWLISGLAAIFIALPHYVEVLGPRHENLDNLNGSEVSVARFEVTGMSCQSCAVHIDLQLEEVMGVLQSASSFEMRQSVVHYDSTQVSLEKLEMVISSTGYKVKSHERLKN